MRTFLLLSLALFKTSIAEEQLCAQCATPGLSDKWSATGLPKRPDGLKFDIDCETPDAEALKTKEWQSGTCSSSCFELMLPLDGYYQFVRGCHEEFVWDEMKVIASNNSAMCQLNKVPGMGNVTFRKADKSMIAFAGISFCKPRLDLAANPSIKLCNQKLVQGEITAEGVPTCTEGTSSTCKSCEENDGSGSCTASSTGTCKGVYCTKTSGKINGHFYESRGCASFNPFAASVCSWADEKMNVSAGVNTDVGLSFRANQCFCQGDQCNSAHSTVTLQTVLLSVFSLIFLIFP